MKTLTYHVQVQMIRDLKTLLKAHDRRTEAIFLYNSSVQKDAVRIVTL